MISKAERGYSRHAENDSLGCGKKILHFFLICIFVFISNEKKEIELSLIDDLTRGVRSPPLESMSDNHATQGWNNGNATP